MIVHHEIKRSKVRSSILHSIVQIVNCDLLRLNLAYIHRLELHSLPTSPTLKSSAFYMRIRLLPTLRKRYKQRMTVYIPPPFFCLPGKIHFCTPPSQSFTDSLPKRTSYQHLQMLCSIWNGTIPHLTLSSLVEGMDGNLAANVCNVWESVKWTRESRIG